MSSEDVHNCICRQCGSGKNGVSVLLTEGNSPERELPARFQVWKLVCSSHLREQFLRSCWIELRHICLSQNFCPVSNDILWKRSVQAVSMWALKAISSTKGVCMPWRQLSARREIDKADTWFSLCYSPDTTKCCGSRTYRQSGWGRYRL